MAEEPAAKRPRAKKLPAKRPWDRMWGMIFDAVLPEVNARLKSQQAGGPGDPEN